MNTTHLMQDPFYLPILFQIESRIAATDRDARSRKLVITDSQVRSILHKVRKASGGSTSRLPTASKREKLLAELHDDLMDLRGALAVENRSGETEDLSLQDWLLALRTVEDSVRLHSTGPGSRGYLLFLDTFIPQEQ